MLGFELDFWDYATFASIFAVVLAGAVFIVWLAAFPVSTERPGWAAVSMPNPPRR